jgi:hypothetical protein
VGCSWGWVIFSMGYGKFIVFPMRDVVVVTVNKIENTGFGWPKPIIPRKLGIQIWKDESNDWEAMRSKLQ